MADTDQNAILKALVRAKACVDTSGLCRLLKIDADDRAARHQVIVKLGLLMRKRLVRRARRGGFQSKPEPAYEATDAGREFIASASGRCSATCGRRHVPISSNRHAGPTRTPRR
jgi:hypothetical protein